MYLHLYLTKLVSYYSVSTVNDIQANRISGIEQGFNLRFQIPFLVQMYLR